MDPLDLSRQALFLLAPFVSQGALATPGEDMSDPVIQLIGQAWGLLRSATNGTPKAENALEVFQDEPDDQHNRQRLAQHLTSYLRQHPQAVDELGELIGRLQTQPQQAGIQGAFTNNGQNSGQQVALNQGAMFQNYGPVTFEMAVKPSKALYQLPPPLPDFVGRSETIARVTEYLAQASSNSGAVAVIRGQGGAGKTQLAYVIANQLCDRFPDGQLLIDALGTSETPRSSQALMQTLIQAFEPEAQPTADLDQTQGRYRSLLHNRRMLIIVDDVRDGDQIETLIPPSGCALLLTTRNRFSFLSTHHVEDLGPLQPSEAEELLHNLCTRLDQPQARQLSALCGQMPLALRISAGRLANDLTVEVDDFLEKMVDIHQRVELLNDSLTSSRNMESVLLASYDRLSAAEQSALRQLTIFPAHFDKEAARKVIEIEAVRPVSQPEKSRPRGRAVPPGIDDVFSTLYRQCWIEYDSASDRYYLHDVVRAFAVARLTQREEGRQWRYALYYAGVMTLVEALYLKGDDYIQEALTLFDRDRIHIDAGRNWACENHDDKLLLAYSSIPDNILRLRYHPRNEWIPLAQKALMAVRRTNNRKLESKILADLGNAYYAATDLQQAQAYYEERLRLNTVCQRTSESTALNGLGNIYYDLGEYQKARSFYEQALGIAREQRNQRNQSAVLANLGNIAFDTGNLQQAFDSYRQAFTIACKLGSRHHEALILVGLGNIELTLGEYQRAQDSYAQALKMSRMLGSGHFESIALICLGGVYGNLGEYHQALGYYEHALTIARVRGDRNREMTASINMSQAYTKLGASDQSVILAEQALCLARDLQHQKNEIQALKALGEAWFAAGDVLHAKDYLEQALTIAEYRRYRPLEAVVRCQLGEVLLAQGYLNEARTHLERALTLAQSMNLKRDVALSNWYLGLVLEQQGNLPQAAEALQVCVDFYHQIGHADAGKHAERLMQVRAATAEQL
jgi:tetratricopeptide (TPR) repeat protein